MGGWEDGVFTISEIFKKKTFFFKCLLGGTLYYFFSSKEVKTKARGSIKNPKINTLCQVGTRDLAFWRRRSRILEFFKVVLVLFKKYFGLLSDHKRSTFGFIFNFKGL